MFVQYVCKILTRAKFFFLDSRAALSFFVPVGLNLIAGRGSRAAGRGSWVVDRGSWVVGTRSPMYTRNVYSCVEEGCLRNLEKLTRQCRKLLWVMVVFTVA